MINVNELKIFIDFIANKEQSGTAYTINQLNNAFQAANIDLFKQRYGLPEEYRPGVPLPKMSYEVTQKIKDDLKACKEVSDLPIDSNGFMQLPDDYVHVTNIEYLKILNNPNCESPTIKEKEVQTIDDKFWSRRKGATIKAPSKDFPICNFRKDSIEFRPKDLGKVQFSYLRVPNKPIWAYTMVSGIDTYDANNSIDFEWNEILLTDVAKLVLGYLSINLKDAELKQAIDNYKQMGV
jgi:hypothetical protein